MRAFLPKMPEPVTAAVEKLLRLDQLTSMWREAARDAAGGQDMADRLLSDLGVRIELSSGDLAKIPETGPVLVVANHPTGMLEGLLLMSVLPKVRKDFKILANSMLGAIPQMREHLFLVDVNDDTAAAQTNVKPVAEALQWLHNGGLLALFPAGVVSTWDWKQISNTDPVWNRGAARFAAVTGAVTVPVYFSGGNSAVFQMLGKIHPALRVARMPGELLSKRGTNVEMRVGHPINALELRAAGGLEAQIEFLRTRTYLLGLRGRNEGKIEQLHSTPLQPGESSLEMQAEIAALPPESKLASQGAFDVYVARARQIPAVLTNIGYLRELTFRAAGEGAGAAADLDSFDAYYEHLFIWHRENREVVGAYRLSKTEPILKRLGASGLYTNTCFRFQPAFFHKVGPAIELGRSFIQAKYQSEFAPLLLLWKGICRYVAANPAYPVLFGAVSISNRYGSLSRALIVEYFKTHAIDDGLSQTVKPRNPFKGPLLSGAELRRYAKALHSVDALSSALEEVESDGKGAPVLLRQYAKYGGRVIAFHVDRDFSDTLDCLILVDLRKTGKVALNRFMGTQEAAAFERFHNGQGERES